MSTENKPSVVFAHGLWADGSCYSKVIPALIEDGHEVVSTQNSLDSLEGDVAAVKRALGQVKSPAILVGHSYGGTVITAAGTDDRVVGLVYICALAPDDDETSQSLQEKFPKTDVLDHIEDFCGDLSPKEQQIVWATQGVPVVDLFNQKIPGAAWKSKPCAYVVGTEDHTVNPELERFVAKRMDAATYEVASSHVAMLSNPDVVIEAILKLAASV
jgi:pimeloyl-ACP methyl ester carboxylesterase